LSKRQEPAYEVVELVGATGAALFFLVSLRFALFSTLKFLGFVNPEKP